MHKPLDMPWPQLPQQLQWLLPWQHLSSLGSSHDGIRTDFGLQEEHHPESRVASCIELWFRISPLLQ